MKTNKRIRTKAVCVKCKKLKEIKAFGECIACYNARRRTKKKFEWSYAHPFCIVCKTTKYKHHGKGFCCKCRATHDGVYVQLQLRRNATRIYTKEDIRIRRQKLRNYGEGKKELYSATARGLKCCKNTKKQIKKDIQIIKNEIKKLQNTRTGT